MTKTTKRFNFIFQQEGSLCAQHALNALLQGNYFTPVDLADIARQLDEHEKATMAEGGETEEFRRFVEVSEAAGKPFKKSAFRASPLLFFPSDSLRPTACAFLFAHSQQPSSNFDDSGYFSIQVLQQALRVWSLELTPFKSSNPVATAARENPV